MTVTYVNLTESICADKVKHMQALVTDGLESVLTKKYARGYVNRSAQTGCPNPINITVSWT